MNEKNKNEIPLKIGVLLVFFMLLPFLMVPDWVYEYSTQKHLVFTVFFMFFFLFTAFRTKLKEIKYNITHLFFLAFGLSTVLSLISVFLENRYYLSYSAEVSLYTLIICAVAVLISNLFGKDFSYIEKGLFTFQITGTIIAFDGLLNKFTGYDIFFGKIGDPSQRITLRTTIGNPNFVSDYLAQLIPIAIYFILKKNSKLPTKIYSLINVFLMYWIVLFAQTRAIYAGFVFGAVLFIISMIVSKKNNETKEYIKSKKFIYWATGVAATLLFLFVMFNIDSPFNKNGEVNAVQRFAATASVSSWDERTLSWLAAVDEFKDSNHPNHFIIGGGIGTYPVYAIKYMEDIQQTDPEKYFYAWNNFKRAHNDYLQVLGETGIIGFISIAGLLLSLIFIFIKVLRTEKDYNKTLLFALYGWSVSVIAIHSFTEFPLHMHPNIMIALFIISTAVSSQFYTNKTLKINVKPVLFILVIISAFVTYFKVNSTLSEVYFKKGNDAYNYMDSYTDAYKNQIPQVLDKITANINDLRQKASSYIGTSEFAKINTSISQLEAQYKDYQNKQAVYQNKAYEYYNTALDYFLKSLDTNSNFGKSGFYLAQLFTKSPYRNYNVNINDLNNIYNLNMPEYRHIIPEYNGSSDLMPFPDNDLRDTIENTYLKTDDTSLNTFFLETQFIYDEINQLETSFISFTEKNSYRLISKLYYSLIYRYNILINNNINKENSEKMMTESYNNFIFWYNKAISILPGGWNRFAEWENLYSEYLSLLYSLNSVMNINDLYKDIKYAVEKDGYANYYMALKYRGIPDESMENLEKIYFILSSENKTDLINTIFTSYKNVYEYYTNIKNSSSQIYNVYKTRIDKFTETYEYFLRKRSDSN